MRNILEYPITKEEKLDLLNKIIESEIEVMNATQRMGDMTVCILNQIKKDIENG